MPTPNAITAAQKFREQLIKMEAASAERMAGIYGRIYTSLQDEARLLADDIASMEEPTQSKILKLTRLTRILNQIRERVARFSGTVEDEIVSIQGQAIRAGLNDALSLIQLSLPPLPASTQAAITSSFTRLPADAVEAAAGLLGDDSPLKEQLQKDFGEHVAGQVGNHILDGIAAGKNPRVIAAIIDRNLKRALGGGLTSALTTVRTAQIKSYQLANHATYQANPRLVPGWTWVADLSDRTCLSCIRQHGTEHPVTETLRDHHAGRCAPVPRTISYKELGINLPDPAPKFESGEAWFGKQPESTQRSMMGPSMFEAYRAGKFSFNDLSRRYDDPVYGELLRQASLKDLLGEQAKKYYTRQATS